MIEQETDGLSRGEMFEGVMKGESKLSYVPLHLNALERRPLLLEWLQEWTGQAYLIPLTPEGWFTEGQGLARRVESYTDDGTWTPKESNASWCLWSPPPAAADVALELLGESRHKRTHINHVVVIPRLMTQAWRRKLNKISDITFEVPPGVEAFWPRSEHEPLVVGLTLRFCSCRPWQVKESDRLLELEGPLREMWKVENRNGWAVLRQLCQLPRMLESM